MAKLEINVGVSNHHVHLTKDVYKYLFEDDIKPFKYISQKGEYSTDKKVTLVGPKGEVNNVRVMGPYREYNQVEVSYSDAYILGVKPPVARSNELENAVFIKVKYNDKVVDLPKSCIMAESHIHMSLEEAQKYGFKDKDKVNVYIDGLRKGMIEAFVKVKENGVLDFHIDRDQANAFLLENGDKVWVDLDRKSL